VPVAARITLILVAGATLSGLVAYLGNRLGRSVGRRKMTLFGLRPKYTSNIITVTTGSMIFLVTLGLAAAVSSEVRIFLGGLDELVRQNQAQVAKLTEQQQELQRRISEDTRKIVAGQILAPYQPLALGVVECGRSDAQTREQLDALLVRANELVLSLNNEAAKKVGQAPFGKETHLVGYIVERKKTLIQELVRRKGTVVCQVLNWEQPAFLGEKVVADFMVRPNPRIFRQGQVIIGTRIDGTLPSDEVEAAVRNFIYRDLQYTALRAGMLRNPLYNRLFTSIDKAALSTQSKVIVDEHRVVTLEVVANVDIFPLGPLDASLRVRP
jgi:uncharacterized protein (DUF3084 family)